MLIIGAVSTSLTECPTNGIVHDLKATRHPAVVCSLGCDAANGVVVYPVAVELLEAIETAGLAGAMAWLDELPQCPVLLYGPQPGH